MKITTVKIAYAKAMVMGGLNAVANAIAEDNPDITADELSKQTWNYCQAIVIGLTDVELYECFQENLERHKQFQDVMNKIKTEGW